MFFKKIKFVPILALSFFPISLSLNLVNFFWMDSVFTICTIAALTWAKNQKVSILKTFGLNNKLLVALISAFFLSTIIGYLLNSPMTANEWNKISNLRWIWGFFASYSMGYIFCATAKDRQLKLWHFSALIVVLFTIAKHHYEVSGTFFFPGIRIKGFYSNTAYFAMATVLLWATLLPFVFYSKNKSEGVVMAGLSVILTGILVATYTRSAWIAMAVVMLFSLLYTKNKKAITISLLAIVATGAAIYFNIFAIKERILHSFDLTGVSQEARIEIWKATWHIFLDHPFFGVGSEYASKIYHQYYLLLGQPTTYIPGHAHNQFLDILSGSGLVGLIGYLGIIACAIVFYHNRFKSSIEVLPKQLSSGALFCIVALFGCSLTETPIIQHEARNYLLIILGFSYGFLSYKDGTNQTTDPHRSLP